MNEGIGGSVVLAIIVVSIVLVISYLAYNVNYTKAFRMKNKVIAMYEQCDGKCGEKCKREILDYAKQIGYTKGSLRDCASLPYRPAGSQLVNNTTSYGYCVYKIKEEQNSHTEDRFKEEPRYYYRVITRIDIESGVMRFIEDFISIDLRLMYVTGDTKMFYPSASQPSQCGSS